MINRIVFLLILINSNLNYSQDTTFVFPRADKVCVEVTSRTFISENKYNYFYDIRSLDCSEQDIWEFRVETKSNDNKIYSPGEWTGSISNLELKTVSWNALDSSLFIRKNEMVPGFRLLSTGIPSVCRYFITGYVPLPVFPLGEEPGTVTDNDIFENSKKGFTICPTDPPVPFIPEDFMDTLLYYNQKSFELGWIPNKSTAEKYSDLFSSAQKNLLENKISSVIKILKNVLTEVNRDSSANLTSEACALLRYNTEYLLKHLPKPAEDISKYSLFAAHSLWLEMGAKVISGDAGVNEAGSPPFPDQDSEVSIGIGAETAEDYSVKGNRIKVKYNARVKGDVFYNDLVNNGTISGSHDTPLQLPLLNELPEFKTSAPGTDNITVAQNRERILEPGSYGNIEIKRSGRLIFTGGEYNINNITAGVNCRLLFRGPSEVKIAGKFESGQGVNTGPADTAAVGANEIIFYVAGINGSTGKLTSLPKAARIGISNKIKANFYVPNGTLWIMMNSEAEGAFIGKDVSIGAGTKIKLNSAF